MERLCSGVTNSKASAAAISALNLTLRQLAFEVLAIERQIADRDEIEGQSIRCKPCERLRELAVHGIAAIAADNDGDLDLCHGWPTLVILLYRG
jgi:hypothetical protein